MRLSPDQARAFMDSSPYQRILRFEVQNHSCSSRKPIQHSSPSFIGSLGPLQVAKDPTAP